VIPAWLAEVVCSPRARAALAVDLERLAELRAELIGLRQDLAELAGGLATTRTALLGQLSAELQERTAQIEAQLQAELTARLDQALADVRVIE